ncbi:MAG: YdiU family protein [Actinomycetota bacterium]
MSVTAPSLFAFEHSFAEELEGLYIEWTPDEVAEPSLIMFNDGLAQGLALDTAGLRSPAGVAALAGSSVPAGARPLAQAYAGHQFGGYSPRLGDGRAVLLGELTDPSGVRYDLHLKGSGRTPFARGGDGKAVLGPMLREFLFGEAMHALGIPTTRALAVVATGEEVARESMLPGAVLARVAASHLRVGTFECVAAAGKDELLTRLVDYSVRRHVPDAVDESRRDQTLALLKYVIDRQAALIADWMTVGFIHGVMNTDNVTISGETIDYGPCAFMDVYDPATVFSSIDHGGRYAYGNQPAIGAWNLSRLAETLITLVDDDIDEAVAQLTEVLQAYPPAFAGHWLDRMRAKLGIVAGDDELDRALADDLLDILGEQDVDFTGAFRTLSSALRLDTAPSFIRPDDDAATAWYRRWSSRVAPDAAERMDAVNPLYIARNHLVEEALDAATAGDLQPFNTLVDVLRSPFTDAGVDTRYELPAPADFGPYRTFCGT